MPPTWPGSTTRCTAGSRSSRSARPSPRGSPFSSGTSPAASHRAHPGCSPATQRTWTAPSRRPRPGGESSSSAGCRPSSSSTGTSPPASPPISSAHTVGTRLINADVPQHIVQQLLDHMSPQMTAIYACLLDKTVGQHWERATKVNAEGQPVDLDEEHPLADAQWMRVSMIRAKVTLPNGYCGAPVQTDCEYANPCLDCQFFLTTGDFMDQHKRQREETARLISDAEASGMKRIAEKNTKTLIKLETLIATLEKAGPRQIVAGGQVEDLDAAG
ncbi:tyrosine-type recombinase/integrase [Streptomyces sp. NPDC057910]|uniref:tyrosine-type recombinase/integrase n=1 Tax=Streptomyces sp. NPDC057910 TaxID=3346278 RepID=UPI0036E65D90